MEKRKEIGYDVTERRANQKKRGDTNKSPSKTLNDNYALRHNKSHHNKEHDNGDKWSSRQTSSSNIEANNERSQFELLHQEQQHNHQNKSSNTNQRKQRRLSSTLSPIRKIISKKISMAFSRSSSGVVRADISGFQQQEEEKTIVRKNLRWHATFLFFLAVSATAIVLLDTQIKILWNSERDFLNTLNTNSTDAEQKEIIHNGLNKLDIYKKLSIALKSLLTISSVLSCVSLLYYYRNLFRLKKVRNFFPPKMSFIRCTPLVKKYLIECVICLFHVPPFLDLYVDVPNEVQIFVILRLYLLGRYLKEKHDLMNSQSTRFLASVTKTELTSMFLFKTFFMQYPFQLILLAYVILLFIGGYGVWIIENRYTYQDTVWMLIITMTTVGFGDLTPKTTLGRFCVGITAIVGIFLMALFISLVNEALMLQRREKRILAYVENQDLTRHRKITALNAIGLWYKYYAHRNKHIRRSGESASFIGGFKNDRTTHQDLMNKVKGKLLETDMFHAVNEWRKIKHARGGNYFAQEFMIEDMKNMMTDLSSKFDELDDKIDNVTVDLKNIQENNNKKPKVEKDVKEEKLQKTSNTTQTHDEIKDSHLRINNNGNIHFSSPKNINFSNNVTRPQLNGGNHNNNNNKKYGGMHEMEQIDRYVTRSRKHVHDFIQEHQKDGTQVIRRKELIVAFKLLKNQAQIMNNALDDIYYKTRQDICDLENLISSLLVCTDGEDGDSVDYVPSRDLPV